MPDWRIDSADQSIYPKRSLTTQYRESDLAFVERLLHEEGLFYFFEHAGDADSPSLGRHTIVIADHNGAFVPNAQSSVLFTQPGAVMKVDSIDRWRSETRWNTNAIEMSSWDYRAVNHRPVSAAGTGEAPLLTSRDTPGAHAYASREQGQRIHSCLLAECRRASFGFASPRRFRRRYARHPQRPFHTVHTSLRRTRSEDCCKL